MKNHLITLSLTSALILSACQSTPVEKKSAAVKDGKQTSAPQKDEKARSANQFAHGAGATDRANFIEEYDTDQDQKVSKAEFGKARAAHHTATDANHNGTVDEQEYVDEYVARLEKKISVERKLQVDQTIIRFGAVDKNDDKKITFAEFKASGTVLFNFLDAKKTGAINLKTPEPDSDDTPDRSVLAMPSTHSVKGFLDIYDLDSNNEVTRADFEQQRKEKFDATDLNHDGSLNVDEYLLEFENRLDRQIKQVRESQLKQAHVRFKALDADKNAALTLQEFNISGDRIFKGWDLNNNGFVAADDPLPEPRKRDKKPDDKTDADKTKS